MRVALTLAVLLAAPPAVAGGLDRKAAREHVRVLTEDIGPRPRNSAAATRAAEYIEKQATDVGLVVEHMPVGTVVSPEIVLFGRQFMPRQTHHVRDHNLVARVAGAQHGPAILLMAHYDTVPGTPGAVDNAASVALLLELGRSLAADPPARPVILAWTASEEYGLSGARALARDLKGQVGLAIALDLIGAADDLSLNGLGALLGEDWLTWLAEASREAGVSPEAPVPHRVISRRFPTIERSDHGAFTEAGVPAFHLYSRGAERIYLDYHYPGDSSARVAWPALDRASTWLDAIVHKPGALPAAGGSPGLWLDVPGGPRVLSSLVLLIIELLLAAAALAGLVALWRRRARARRRFAVGLVAFAVGYAIAWLAASLAFALARWYSEHPAPWVHAPLRYYLLSITIATGVGIGAAWVARERIPLVGCGRFLAAAIVPNVLAAAGLVALGATEMAIVPVAIAACFGAAAWCKEWHTAVPWVAISMLPLWLALDPGLLREGVFHGFFPAEAPIWIALALVLAPHTLAVVYLWRRFAPPPARDGTRTLIVAAIVAAVVLAAFALATISEPSCSGAGFQERSLYCERYGD